MPIPLEDTFTDIFNKAQCGLDISDRTLAEKSGASVEQIRHLRDGEFDRDTIEKVAPVLRLNAAALSAIGRNKWRPNEVGFLGLAQFNTPFHDITVNSYLLWDHESKEAVAFDTGADCSAMLRRSVKDRLVIKLILLTHAHSDHITDLRRLGDATGAPIFLSGREEAPGAQSIDEGRTFTVGKLHIESRHTWGHSSGGMTYVVRGLTHPIAIVGDSLFAGSMGGGNVSYADAVRNNLEKILTLPNETVLCPGHGPMTTVGEEKVHNPFFAAS